MRRIAGLASLALAILLAACGGQSPFTAAFDPAALETTNGGLLVEDEQPYFGERDSFMEASVDFEPPHDDSLVSQATGNGAPRYRFLVVRGRSVADSDGVITWSAAVHVSAMGMSLRPHRVVRFEPEHATVQSASDGRSFTVATRASTDGVLVEVVIPDGASGPAVSFSGPVETILTVEEISDMGKPIERQGVDGSWLVFYPMPQRPCPSGFIAGYWKRVHERGGVFYAHWAGDEGTVTGYLLGIWGRRLSGEKVFFAKVIDRQGRFLGLLKGTYDDHRLRGFYVENDGAGPAGVLTGQVRGEGGGTFHARWSRLCDADSSGE